MAAVNGFTATAPDTRYGDAEYGNLTTWSDAASYVAGGSGTQELTEIGGYFDKAISDTAIKIAVFEHDAANGCPGAMVSNSEGSLTVTETGHTKYAHVYAGTKPQVTGGSTYWIATISDGSRLTSVFATGGTSLERGSVTYPTWPSGDDWHTHSDLTKDYSFYAVYQAMGGTTYPTTVILRQYAQQIGA